MIIFKNYELDPQCDDAPRIKRDCPSQSCKQMLRAHRSTQSAGVGLHKNPSEPTASAVLCSEFGSELLLCLPSPGVPVRLSHCHPSPQEPSLSCMKATPAFWRTVSVFCFSSSISWDTQISEFSSASPQAQPAAPGAQHIHTQGWHRKVNEAF